MLRHMLIILTYLVVHNLNAQLYTLNLHSPENKTITHWLREQPKLQDSIQWRFAQNDMIQRLHQDGYLLAEIEVWNFENDTLHAIVSPEIIIEPGYQIKLDTIEIEGTARLSEHYLEKTLGIQKGEPLTQEAIILLH